MMVPPYPPGGIPVVDEVSPVPAPDEAGGFWPEWVPTLAPETAVVVAAVAGVLVLVLALVVFIRRLRRPSTPPGVDGQAAPDPWVRRLIGAILVSVPMLLALTFYGSFYAVEAFAADRHVDPSWVPPLAIDGTLVVFLLFDLLFARLGRPNAFVKQTTRGFILLTLVANAASGWGDLAAVFLHVPAPLAIVVLTEVSRQALVDEARRQSGKAEFDPIPFLRWVLAPRSTFGIWRWMILQDVRSYSRALAADHDRRDALAIIDMFPAASTPVPVYLARRLRDGMDVAATAARVRALAGVAEVGPVAGSSTAGVGGVDPHEAAPTVPGVDVHSDPTPGPTPAPDGGVEAARNGVGHRVDEADTDSVSDMSDTPVPGVPSTPAPDGGVDEANEADTDPAPGVDTHPGPVWRSPNGHPHEVEANPNEVGRPVEGPALEASPTPVPSPVVATDGDHDEDDTDPDDEGPGPRGGGVPAPADVLPGQITITDALEGAPTPGPLDVARLALDAPVWDDVADEKAKKPKVMALLWEFSGDVTAARAAWQDRMVDEFPRDVYRSGSRGYAWQWHHEVTAYLISEYGHADTVRAVLAAAGVDHHHEAVSAALDAWADTHGSQVLQFRRPTPTGS